MGMHEKTPIPFPGWIIDVCVNGHPPRYNPPPVSNLSKYSSDPVKTHWTATQCVLRYLNGTHDLGLVLGGKQPITLQGHIDSDFTQDLADWKSISSYTFNLGISAISWSSKKQVIVAGSSMEAKYVTTDHATKEAMWLCTLLSLLGHSQPGPMLI